MIIMNLMRTLLPPTQVVVTAAATIRYLHAAAAAAAVTGTWRESRESAVQPVPVDHRRSSRI